MKKTGKIWRRDLEEFLSLGNKDKYLNNSIFTFTLIFELDEEYCFKMFFIFFYVIIYIIM